MTNQNAPHVVLFKYKWSRIDADVAVVGPFSSAQEAGAVLVHVRNEGFCDYDADVVPFSSLDEVAAELRKHKEKVDAEVAAELARRGGQLTIDEVLKRCEGLPDLPVVISSATQYDGMSPDNTGSYRGSYDELAIEPKPGEPKVLLLSSFKKEMESSIGYCYSGYKGGEYYMYGDTYVWVSEYGMSSGLAVVDLRLSDDGQRVLLVCDQK